MKKLEPTGKANQATHTCSHVFWKILSHTELETTNEEGDSNKEALQTVYIFEQMRQKICVVEIINYVLNLSMVNLTSAHIKIDFE